MKSRRSSLVLLSTALFSIIVYIATPTAMLWAQKLPPDNHVPPQNGVPADTPEAPPQLSLSLKSVEPFLSVATEAGQTIRLPKHTKVTFSASYLSPPAEVRFHWEGAREEFHTQNDSTAVTEFSKPGTYLVRVTPSLPDGFGNRVPVEGAARSTVVVVSNIPAESIHIRIVRPAEWPLVVSARRQVTCKATTSVPGYEHLIQWDGGGTPTVGTGALFSTSYSSHGQYALRAGKSDSLDITVYEISQIERVSGFGDRVWYGFPIMFTAKTIPPDYRDRINWVVDTHDDMYTHAEPRSGQGASFTTTFFRTSSATSFWAQVYADQEAALSETDSPPPPWPPCSTTGIDTAVEFFDFSACFLNFALDSHLATRPLADQARAAQYQSVYHSSVTRLHDHLINQVLPTIPPSSLSAFEQSLTTSGLIDEFSAYFQTFDPSLAPPSPLTASEWQEAQDESSKQATDTIKGKIKNFLEAAPGFLGDFAETIVKIICEIIAIFF